jgi:hypothetical protein
MREGAKFLSAAGRNIIVAIDSITVPLLSAPLARVPKAIRPVPLMRKAKIRFVG